MASYDSDDSLSDAESGSATNVLLGYASKTPTEDSISQLGGEPTWLDVGQHPSPILAQCKCCSNHLQLLLQLNGDLPDRFPNHERRLYIWGCKRKACRRKPGSVRALRAIRASEPHNKPHARTPEKSGGSEVDRISEQKPRADVGGALFGRQANLTSGENPFSSGPSSNPFSMSSSSNPFSSSLVSNPFSTVPGPASLLAAKPPQRPTTEPKDEMKDLPATFAAKASIAVIPPVLSSSQPPEPQAATLPWPEASRLPKPYPQYHLDADYEYLSSSSAEQPSANHTAFMDLDTDAGSSNGKGKGVEKEDADLYESAHDKAFQHFADTLAQNPEQVLRYEFGGSPLLYSRSDAVGRMFGASHTTSNAKITTTSASGHKIAATIPNCENCGASRVFEVQLTPHAIAELEAEEEAVTLLGDGMEWGTIIVAVCSRDCGSKDGKVDYVEEWAGVQWEEVVSRGSSRN